MPTENIFAPPAPTAGLNCADYTLKACGNRLFKVVRQDDDLAILGFAVQSTQSSKFRV
jgi:hypothetical protein